MTQTVPKGFVRAYLRASTTEQDATRALDTINTFAIERGLSICNYYIENESGSKLERPELFRLLKDCQQNDILLVEDVDRLSRRHCCKVSDEAAFCLIQRPYISKTLLTRRISPRGSP